VTSHPGPVIPPAPPKQTFSVRIITADPHGNPHPVGTVVPVDGKHYLVGPGGALQRVKVIEEIGNRVRFRTIAHLSKAQKKAAKRQRIEARNAQAAHAIRIARRHLASLESHA
jgi:hypothetical protein